ncbi:hypothetical protein CVT24_001401 [Panaeolus cyanescens]|uniref:Carrier domain-containing protein n=1 Tax=Panaeolus cyanescens TaxID=181874 RepID=A0A409W3F6_9AGAR|nr:hypothetical protein CVT24_001401 [Panaeolus cyanescens]
MSPPIAIVSSSLLVVVNSLEHIFQVGVSVELPSGDYSTENLNHQTFFEFLLSGGEAYGVAPSDRFNLQAWKGTGLGKIHVDKGAFLKNIDTFDNVEFGISSKDAQTMAPASRKLLENSFLALLDSGIDYRLKSVGCYMSGTSLDVTNVSDPDEYDAKGSFAGYPSMIANRISNHLDLLGPSVPMDTACSSTLTAMHLAVQAISNGDCEAALVGGCQLNHRFIDWMTYSQGSLLAKDGKCKPFDSKADGFSRAEGCAVVVIKRLEDAIRDNDHIYATILGTAINSTGGAAPPGAPVGESQRDAMIQAFKRAGKSPRDVDFVELHATGTAKGDPTEANWVGEHFHRADDLIVGSVKGNIGHTEIVAFLASLSKSISILNNRVIPPQVNVRELNPAIKWKDYRLRLPLGPTPLPCRSNDKSLIAIAGSGIGGSNGHVVIESAPAFVAPSQQTDGLKRPTLITVGGLSSRAVAAFSDALKANFNAYLEDLPGLSTVLGRRTKQATWRSYTILGADQTSLPEIPGAQHAPRLPNSLVWVFSGQGPQHKDMGRELFEAFPVFRQSVLEMDEVFKSATGVSIIEDYGLFHGQGTLKLPDVWPIRLVLPSIAIFQIALFDLLASLGVKPHVIVGHSAGETAMLYASGAAPKAMAVELAIIRGRCFTPIEQLGGTMAAVSCNAEEMQKMIDEYRLTMSQGTVDIACFNAPSAVAIAGDEIVIDALVEKAESRRIFARKIRTKVPFHSSMMEWAKDSYMDALEDLFKRYPGDHTPHIPVFSTCTGKLFEGAFDAQYFWTNTRSPVRFTEAMDSIKAAHPSSTFVEFSPHPVLASYVSSMASESSTVLHSVQRPKKGAASTEYVDLLHLLGKITSAGHNDVDFTALNHRKCAQFNIPLPAYPFVKKTYPLYPDTPAMAKQLMTPNGPLNHPFLRMNKETHPTLAEHVIRGEPIMPAAGFLEMALEFGAPTLMNVNLRSILSLSSEKPVQVDIKLDGAFWTVHSTATSKLRNGTSVPKLHADGYLSYEVPLQLPPLDIGAVRGRCPDHVGSAFYPSLSYFSNYGPPFQRVTSVFYGRNEALASINGLDEALLREGKYLLHPTILDACIQVTAYKPFHGDYDPNVYYLPAHLDAVVVHEPLKDGFFPAHIYAHVELKKWTPTGMHYDISLVDDSGVRLCTFFGLEVAKHHINPVMDISRPFQATHQPVFHQERKIVELPVAFEQRVDLFSALDKFVIRHQALMKNAASSGPVDLKSFGPILNYKWSSYLETFNASENIVHEGPQFDAAIATSVAALRDALTSICKNSSKVVDILVISNIKNEVLPTSLTKVLAEFGSSYLQLFFNSKHVSASPSVSNGIVRKVNVNFTADGPEGIQDQLFDIVLTLNVANDQVDPFILAKNAQELLTPGGTLIATERNMTAWENSALGVLWYNATYGQPTPADTYALDKYTSSFKDHGLKVLHSRYSEDIDPFHFSLIAQKASYVLGTLPTTAIFDSQEDFVYAYSFGNEMDLQWELSGLNVLQKLNIWITATEGRDGGAAQGLTRALRREYVSWTVRLVIFPAEYHDDERQSIIENFPAELRQEREIYISNDKQVLVSRLVPYSLPGLPVSKAGDESAVSTLPPHHISVRPLSSSVQGQIAGFVARVEDGNLSELKHGAIVVGLTDKPITDVINLDAGSVYQVSPNFIHHADFVSTVVPGLVTSILAPGFATFAREHRLASMRILLTHSDSLMGQNIMATLSRHCASVDRVTQDTNLFELSKLVGADYDLIVSGYSDRPYIQMLNAIQRDGGKTFLWNEPSSGLRQVLRSDPCAVGDALRHALDTIGVDIPSLKQVTTEINSQLNGRSGETQSGNKSGQTRFDPSKAYVILGGIGTIGAHLAMYMYQHGARRIVLTSRSGQKSLQKNPNVIISRMLNYLAESPELDLSFHAVDATAPDSMADLVKELGRDTIGGCIILTAVLSDRVFNHLSEEEFTTVFHAKLGALETVKKVVDVEKMEFVCSFTSVSGLFGFGGQTNYGAANTALEEETSHLSNGFSFVCPGVLDSTLMLAGTGEESVARLNHHIPWSVSAEDMIAFFDDAMYRFQQGQSVGRYVPDLNWEGLERTQGIPRIGHHLIPSQSTEVQEDQDDMERMADIVRGVLDIPAADFSPHVPLTAYGIDSLSASRISFLLRPYVEVTQIQLLADLSLNDLRPQTDDVSEAVMPQEIVKPAAPKTKPVLMEEMLGKYAANLTPAEPLETPITASHEATLITGTTGTLGAHVLSQLLQRPEIGRVYALNRARVGTSLRDRQHKIFAREGLDLSLLDSSKLVLLQGDLTNADLGLETKQVDELLSSVTHVIHNAWAVDFLTSLSDHEDLIQGTRHLIDFAQRSRLSVKPSLSYISTIGIFQDPKQAGYTSYAPEEPVLDPKVSIQTGYIESKWVAERLFQLAAEKGGLKTNVIRVGLLTGSSNGSWDASQWFPAIAQSATYLGCLPEGNDLISWIPVDVASSAIVDMRQATSPTGPETLHLVHPSPARWKDIMEPLAEIFNVPLVPYLEWFARLESSARQADSGKSSSPSSTRAALKLTHFYRIALGSSPEVTESMGLLPNVSAQKGFSASATLQSDCLMSLGREDVNKWVSYWRSIGFLPSA